MASPLDIMKNRIQLTLPVTLPPNGFLVDYTRIKKNVKKIDDLTTLTPATNDDWKYINNPNFKVGKIMKERMRKLYPPAPSASAAAANEFPEIEITTALDKLDSKITYILDNPVEGLKAIFENMAQSINPNGSWKTGGGPKDFFRFLFDFAIPSGVNIRCDILEKPQAGGANGQCWKTYGSEVEPNETHYPKKGSPKWAHTARGPRTNMNCYICDVDLTLGKKSLNPMTLMSGRDIAKKNMQCEHLFPFTEGMLFWILNLSAIKVEPIDDAYKEALRQIQVREYAPVCQDCNGRLKSSIGILMLNNKWIEGELGEEQIVIVNDLHLQKIACNPSWDRDYFQNHNLTKPITNVKKTQAYIDRKNRLRKVFNPLVDAINKSLKNRGVNSPVLLAKFLIYKYFSYFSDDVVDKIRVMLAGGESAKQLNNEKKSRNKIFGKMIKNLSNFMKTINKNIQTKTKTLSVKKTAVMKTQKEVARASNRTKPSKESLAAAAKQQEDEAKIALDKAKSKKNIVMGKIKSIFSIFFPEEEFNEDNIKEKINAINNTLKQTTTSSTIDYTAAINTAKQAIVNTNLDAIENEVASSGGGKKQKGKYIQSGGDRISLHDMDTFDDNYLLELYINYLLTEYISIDIEENINMNYLPNIQDIKFLSKSLSYLKNNVVGSNEYAIKKIKEEIKNINSKLSRGAHCSMEQRSDDSSTLEEYLEEIDPRNRYFSNNNTVVDDNTLRITEQLEEAQENAIEIAKIIYSKLGQTTLSRYWKSLSKIKTSFPNYMFKQVNWVAFTSRCLSCAKTKEGYGIYYKSVRGKKVKYYKYKDSRVMHRLVIKNDKNKIYYDGAYSLPRKKELPIIYCSTCIKKMKKLLKGDYNPPDSGFNQTVHRQYNNYDRKVNDIKQFISKKNEYEQTQELTIPQMLSHPQRRQRQQQQRQQPSPQDVLANTRIINQSINDNWSISLAEMAKVKQEWKKKNGKYDDYMKDLSQSVGSTMEVQRNLTSFGRRVLEKEQLVRLDMANKFTGIVIQVNANLKLGFRPTTIRKLGHFLKCRGTKRSPPCSKSTSRPAKQSRQGNPLTRINIFELRQLILNKVKHYVQGEIYSGVRSRNWWAYPNVKIGLSLLRSENIMSRVNIDSLIVSSETLCNNQGPISRVTLGKLDEFVINNNVYLCSPHKNKKDVVWACFKLWRKAWRQQPTNPTYLIWQTSKYVEQELERIREEEERRREERRRRRGGKKTRRRIKKKKKTRRRIKKKKKTRRKNKRKKKTKRHRKKKKKTRRRR